MKGRIGCIADCTECDWTDHHYFTARESAKKHARETGHRVVGEETVLFVYGKTKPTKDEQL